MGFLIIFLLTVLQLSPIPPPFAHLYPASPSPGLHCGVGPWAMNICSMANLILDMSSQVSLSVFHNLTDVYVYKYYLFLNYSYLPNDFWIINILGCDEPKNYRASEIEKKVVFCVCKIS